MTITRYIEYLCDAFLIDSAVREDSKIVEIWLDHRDQNDLQLSAKLRPLFADYNGKKYTVAVFQSGKEDLYEQTRPLLLHNRDYFAGLESKQSQ